MVTLELKLNDDSARLLSHTAMKSFFIDQRHRFEIIDYDSARKVCKAITKAESFGRGVFFWFNTYLESKVYQCYYSQTTGRESFILWDLADQWDYVVWVDEDESFIMPKHSDKGGIS
jgi:hypothetical protein